ncbi:Plasma membrane ATP-binding cassette (ABC) transporter [Komagataella phaffii CBS 7435]|uniref:Plasma membrane ATP-binding cassette (ABC) transporter n=2 Tax=Komagataella phaffii TaxID=460519 RepID=C4R926_KOMPG|nr:Plasma membrane ATP-binding cassette (ABC) transporter [Komagataella phaffii GS115]AOA65255.1 GQ67_05224T0 [Komagataella phaffii]CAH2450489.1 Plasma membrane ATP-binding cassette (ABC) transporter [Komagataella phaffii CBS 7435]AOA69707.1 GQ68_05206T0 [Komagataella phaffii GS115]CAY72101.1 Plasma membrane ATP-binding cassette (ABC) transporter [Komagataella phaffii GS115]CCA40295.1 Plasma membrane ATP-binding cassette (ABC) transporter [Komagataella phaffii CBS 7435]
MSSTSSSINDKDKESSNIDSPKDTVPYEPTRFVGDLENQNEDDIYSEQLSRILTQSEAVQKIQSLARTMSRMTKKELAAFEVNQDDFDLKILLHYLRAKSEEQGIESCSAGVAFKNLTATGIDVSAAYGPTVDEMLRNFFMWPIRFAKREHVKTRQIIRNFTGSIEAGELCLVLGRPGAGCSTLLKCCTGNTSELLSVEGEFSYDGLDQAEMMKDYKGYVIYNPELDTHFPHITVKQTIDFALKMKTPAKRVDGIPRKKYIDTMRDLWCTVFGLRHTYGTKVGNDFIRGVSGGERKRVSIVEALATGASVYAWDNATRGLDASTALEFTQAIRTSTNLLNASGMVAIYQAGENIYELFDKVCVLYNGKQVYFGPAEKARKYFEDMGWYKPPRMTTPEFLTAVTDPSGRFIREGFKNKVPENSEDFEQYWLNSPEYQECLRSHDQYIQDHNPEETRQRLATAKSQTRQKAVRSKSRFVASYPNQIAYCVTRGFQRTKGEIAYTLVYLSSFLTKGFIVGSMYWNIPKDTSGLFSRSGILFYCLLFCAVTSLSEISHTYTNRPIILKQKSYSLYHQSAESLQEIITELPTKLVAVIILALTTYFMPGLRLSDGGSAFWMYLLFLLLIQQCMSFMFKLIATLTRDAGTAHACGGLLALMMCVYTGFIIPLPYMHHWIKWFNWINPMRYCYESLLATELHSREMKCSEYIPNGPDYEGISMENSACTTTAYNHTTGLVSGNAFLTATYNYRYSHVWRNFGINIAWTAGFIIINTILSEFVKNVEGGGDMLLYKRGHMPKEGIEAVDGKVASKQEMMEALNGPDVDLKKVIAERDVFTWQHLDYVIPYGGATRQLLNDVQGYVKPGTMTALMGESGAGKTTLLNTLSQRINFGTITGDIFVNGRPLDSSFKRRTGFVQQSDLHLAEYSVRESLRFAVNLRQSEKVPQAEKYEYVEKIINLLGMQNYAEAIIGKIGRGLNVEQRKKLSIAVELVAKPSLLLFLDEPTSGLDSQSAWSIIQFLRALSDSGQAILCTIHQPSATLFEVFDRLLLLKKGGRTVYFGDIGPNSSTMLSYFERESGIKCGVSENPAEYILNCIGAGATAHASADWGDLWVSSPEHAAVTEEISRLNTELQKRPLPENIEDLQSKFATSYPHQIKILFLRTMVQFWRSPVYIRAKFLEAVVCAIFVGFSFVKVGHGLQEAQFGLTSIFMMLIISLAMINQMHVFAFDSRELFEARESASNTFHWSTLLLAQTWWETIWCMACQFLCFVCYYFPAGFSGTAHHAGYFFLQFVIIFPIYYCSYGLWVLYFSPDVPSAGMINSNFFAAMLLFCGVLQPPQFMPGFWTFMYKLSPYTYFVQSFVAPLVHNRKLVCRTNEYTLITPPEGQTCSEFLDPFIESDGGYLGNPDATESCEYCPYTYQSQVMEQFNIKWSYRWRNFGFFFAYIIFNYVALLSCYYLMRVKVWNMKSILNFKKWFNGPRKERHDPETNIFAAQPADAKLAVLKKKE